MNDPKKDPKTATDGVWVSKHIRRLTEAYVATMREIRTLPETEEQHGNAMHHPLGPAFE